MAEKIISPGVFTKEIDASFLPAAIGDIGAALVGPTVKGPALVPTVVSSYSEFQSKFGDTFKSGSQTYQYLTSFTAANYLKHSGKLTVVRILDGNYDGANALIPMTGSLMSSTAGDVASASVTINTVGSSSMHQLTINSVDFIGVTSASIFNNSATERYFTIGADTEVDTIYAVNLRKAINDANDDSTCLVNVTASYTDATNNLALSASSGGIGGNSYTLATSSAQDPADTQPVYSAGSSPADGTLEAGIFGGGTAGSETVTTGTSFKLNTFSHGAILNNSASGVGAVTENDGNALASGSADNIRWEISSINESKGTFTLLIRRGDDIINRKQILETWNNCSLDPNAPNYISKMLGDSYQSIDVTGTFIEFTGNYPVKSKYVYVSNVKDTIDYMDEKGNVRIATYSGSLPAVGSGSAGGSFDGGKNGIAGFDSLGNVVTSSGGGIEEAYSFFENIGNGNSQGYKLSSTTAQDGGSSYMEALGLLSNADEYDINLLMVPGIFDDASAGTAHPAIINKGIEICENRGDCFFIYDTVIKGGTIVGATGKAKGRDSNYAATYWPWVQVLDNQTGAFRWVPPSTVMPGIYAFNDKVAAPWFAPAGLNRGGLDTVIQAERKLTHANRDTLYESNVNPIATFPGQGVVVWGQKTLQKKSSALDRVNVRRLLIKVKKFIAASSRFLVFEQNNAQTRERFLNIANPYLEQVQAQSGLNAFKVTMDETNNTPDIVDRNILYGQIFLQPTKTAEFIVLDFTIQPTGAAFGE